MTCWTLPTTFIKSEKNYVAIDQVEYRMNCCIYTLRIIRIPFRRIFIGSKLSKLWNQKSVDGHQLQISVKLFHQHKLFVKE